MEDAAEKYPIPKAKDENNKDSENEIQYPKFIIGEKI